MADVPSFLKIAIQKGIVSEEQINECFDLQRKSIEMGMEISIEQVFINKKYLTSEQIKALYKNAGYKEKSPIEGYEFIQKLGEGGMGSVYLTKQTRTERLCAVKILPPKLAKQNPDYAERFLREARTVAKLQHQNIVGGYDTGKAGEYFYFVMEYVDGSSLGKLIEEKGLLPENEALNIFIPVAQALDYASGIGLVHRDIKPDNILLTKEGIPKVADFGLAKLEGQASLTQTGFGMGTPAYISPEQAHGSKNLDTRADIYSLGCTLYHTVCGETPFTGDNPLLVIKAHCDNPLPDPRTCNPGLSEGICRVIKKMCAKKPENRYQSCAELVDALQKVQAGEYPPAIPAPEKSPVKKESKKFATKETSRESGKVSTRETSRESGRVSTRETSRESGKVSTRETSRGPSRESSRESVRPSSRTTARSTEKKSNLAVIAGIIGGVVLLVVVLLLSLGSSAETENANTAKRTDDSTPKTTSTKEKKETTSKENKEKPPRDESTPKKANKTSQPPDEISKIKKELVILVDSINNDPRDLATVSDKLNSLLNRSDDRDLSAEIKKAQNNVRDKQNSIAAKIRDKIKSETEGLIKNNKYKAALEKMDEFPQELKSTVAGKQLSNEREDVDRSAKMKIEARIKYADELAEKNEFAKAKAQMHELRNWDLEIAQLKAGDLLQTIEEKEKSWLEEKEHQAQEEFEVAYFAYLPELSQQTKCLNFDSATKLIHDKSEKCKDAKIKLWYQEDLKCVNRAHKFWDKTLAGLKGKEITVKDKMTGKFQEFNEEKRMLYIDLGGANVGARWDDIKPKEREGILNKSGLSKSLDSTLFILFTGAEESTSGDIQKYLKNSDLDADHLSQVAAFFTGGALELEAQKILEDCKKLFAEEKWERLQNNIDILRDKYSNCKLTKDAEDELAKWNDAIKENLTPSPARLLKNAAAEARACFNDKRYDDLENKITFIQNNFKEPKLLESIADEMGKWKEAVEKAHKAAEAGTPENVRTWINTLKNEKSDLIERAKAAEMLGDSDSKSAIPALHDILSDDKGKSQIRAAAAMALGKLKAKTVIPELGKNVVGNDRMVSENSATALGLMDDKSALSELRNALKTQKAWYVRVKIIDGIGKYLNKEDISLLKDTVVNDKMPMVSEAAAQALTNFPKNMVQKELIEIIQTPGIDLSAMKAICAYVVKNPDKDATKALIKSLKEYPKDEKNNSARGAMIDALGQLKDPAAMEVIMDIYLNENVRSLQLTLTRAASAIAGSSPKGAIYTDVEKWRTWYNNEYKRKH